MCVDHVGTSPYPSQIYPPSHPHPQICVLIFKKKNPEVQIHCIFLDVWTSTWVWMTYKELHSLRKLTPPLPAGYQFPIVPLLRVQIDADLSIPNWNFVWINFVRMSLVHAVAIAVQLPCYALKALFSCSHLQPLAHTFFCPPLLYWYLSLGRKEHDVEVSYRVTIPHSLFFSTWPICESISMPNTIYFDEKVSKHINSQI